MKRYLLQISYYFTRKSRYSVDAVLKFRGIQISLTSGGFQDYRLFDPLRMFLTGGSDFTKDRFLLVRIKSVHRLG